MQTTNLTQAIQEAISKEHEDVAMYESMLKLIPADQGDMARAVQGILENEMRHARVLRSFLPQLQEA